MTEDYMNMKGLDVIKAYREKKYDWLPMVADAVSVMPSRNSFGDVNIGWNAGLLDENRPYFAEVWATEGITMLTLFVSKKGIEDLTAEELERRFLKAGYYTPRENAWRAEMITFIDRADNEFFALNVCVGDEDGTYLDGAFIFSFKVLNEYNSAFDNSGDPVRADRKSSGAQEKKTGKIWEKEKKRMLI